ncbi:hypothetical protein CVV38_03410 [Candidatus Peregrinibacteria bacterium HGW-Peregrinibacteria-1]|jgi:aquaporin Z|nr:MAG: hypothetical protein CVV38_03410 [Candidatus Peregrinibacteria bacterium HGW-Peregrinibacteria-1]
MKVQKYFAEALGTFLLTMTIFAATQYGGLTPLFIGIGLLVLMYTLGPISGGHFNPAVTIALLTRKKLKLQDGLAYILAQFLGAILGIFLFSYSITIDFSEFTKQTFNLYEFIGEIVGTFILLYGVITVVSKKDYSHLSGVIIGFSLMIGIMIAQGLGSMTILNPAIAIAFGNASWIYLVAPIIGGTAAVWTHRLINE